MVGVDDLLCSREIGNPFVDSIFFKGRNDEKN